MTREELEAALNVRGRRHDGEMYGCVACYRNEPCADRTIIAAARKQLALMPEKCGTCGGRGDGMVDKGPLVGLIAPCPTCHGSGKVYPPETVEKIVTVLDAWVPDPYRMGVAVLDALGETE